MTVERNSLDVKQVGNVVLISLRGTFLAVDHEWLNTVYLQQLIEGMIFFLFDLSEARTLQSVIIGGILELYKKVSLIGGGVRLVHPSGQVKYILNLSRLSTLLPVDDSSDDALRVCQNQSP